MTITTDIILPFLLWIPVVSLFANFILIIFLVVVIQKGKLKTREQQEIEKKMMEIVNNADKKTIEIIDEAIEKAKEIVNQAQGTKKLLEEKLDRLVDDTTDIAQNELNAQKTIIVEKFRDGYTEVVNQFEGETQILMAELQHDSREIRRTFSDAVKKDTIDVLRKLTDTAEKQIVDVDKEINLYRDDSFKKIDEHANAIIKQIVNEYFNEDLTEKTHESILEKTFEKFKEQIKPKQ